MNDTEGKLKRLTDCKHVENSSSVFNMNNPQTILVNIRPNKSVSRGMFKPDPLLPGGYIAHPITIRALKKDIFTGGDDVTDLEDIHICESCKSEIDIQFWFFCPICEASIPHKT